MSKRKLIVETLKGFPIKMLPSKALEDNYSSKKQKLVAPSKADVQNSLQILKNFSLFSEKRSSNVESHYKI